VSGLAERDCCARTRNLRSARRAGPWLLLALLVPKCPLCVAAWFAAAGLAGVADLTARHLDPHALSALMIACALAGLACLVRDYRSTVARS